MPTSQSDNVDYNDIKQFIKEKTTHENETLPVTIPGPDSAEQTAPQFEDELFNILNDQFQRINLFTKSKYGEIDRRIDQLDRQLHQLKNADSPRTPDTRRYLRLARDADDVGEEIKKLSQFVGTQRVAFRKLLKKYRKWTGSSSLELRLNNEAFQRTDTKTFVPAFDKILERFAKVQALLEEYRVGHDIHKKSTKPGRRRPRKERSALTKQPSTQSSADDPASSVFSVGAGPSSATSVGESETTLAGEISAQPKRKHPSHTDSTPKDNPQLLQRYWNEFDDDEEQQDNQYYILVDPDASFPGAELLQRIKSFFSRKRESEDHLENSPDQDDTLQPLLPNNKAYPSDDGETSSSSEGGNHSIQNQVFSYPPPYQYGSLSTNPQTTLRRRTRTHKRRRLSRRARRERLLLIAYISCYVSSLALLLTSLLLETFLQPNGHHKPRTRAIHVGALIGVVAALGLGCLGLALMARRREPVGWSHRLAGWLVMMVVLAGAVVGIVVVGEAW